MWLSYYLFKGSTANKDILLSTKSHDNSSPDFLLKSSAPEPDTARSANPTTSVVLPKTELLSGWQNVAGDGDGFWPPIAQMLPNTTGDCPAFLDNR